MHMSMQGIELYAADQYKACLVLTPFFSRGGNKLHY